MEVAINECFGGFELSNKAYERLIKLGIKYFDSWEEFEIEKKKGFSGIYIVKKDYSCFGDYSSNFDRKENRTNELLIRVIKELGEEANARCSCLKIVDIPNDINWEIEEYDGLEHVAECHRIWQ